MAIYTWFILIKNGDFPWQTAKLPEGIAPSDNLTDEHANERFWTNYPAFWIFNIPGIDGKKW